jgi:DNA polymerase elongation subunit (family B)
MKEKIISKYLLSIEDEEEDDIFESSDAEEEDDNGYQGGKVLTAQSGRYTDPVAVFDFARCVSFQFWTRE